MILLDALGWSVVLGLAGCGGPTAREPDLSLERVVNVAPAASQRALPPGSNPVQVANPNDFRVAVELRSGGAARQFVVEPHAGARVLVPDGSYEVFFVYAHEPEARYSGDAFVLEGQGIEIKIVESSSVNQGRGRGP